MTTFADALRQLAETKGDAPAVTFLDETMTFREVDLASNRLAHAYAKLGVKAGDTVLIGLPNSTEFVLAALAIWKLGAVPNPISAKLPAAELSAIVEVAEPALVIGFETAAAASVPAGFEPDPSLPDGPIEGNPISPYWKAVTSGGSTGRPKLIRTPTPAVYEEVTPLGLLGQLQPNEVELTTGPMSHNGPFMFGMMSLLMGSHVVVMPRFDAEEALRLIERYGVKWLYIVPTTMQRISKLDPEVRAKYDASSIRVVMHMAAPCPAWVKEDWISWLGPEKIWELYAGTEAQAVTMLNGAMWLEHKGSVGPVVVGEMQIRRKDGSLADVDEMGEVWMRRGEGAAPSYVYVGAEAKADDGGWESLGDMGRMDADGYLYLGDRDSDMILVGGSNVYPAEIEGALSEHPLVKSCAVIGLPHADLGAAPHAIVETAGDVSDEELTAHLRERLSPYKLPKTWERVSESLRDDAGKVRRSALRAARLT